MSQLDRLPEITEKALYGLQADDALKTQILSASVSCTEDSQAINRRRLIPLVCAMSAVLLLLFGLGTGFRSLHGNIREPSFFTSATHTSVSPILMRSFLSENSHE